MILILSQLFVYRCIYLASRNMSHKVFVIRNAEAQRTQPPLAYRSEQRHWQVCGRRYYHEEIPVGEVYEVNETMLSKLDILEDHPNYYVREIDNIIVKTSSNELETLQCWVYFLKTFKPDLLNRPHLDSYSSKGLHGLPYLESCNESTLDDLDDVLQK